MKETKTIDIRINILGQPLELTVDFDQQDHVREVEAHIAGLYRQWRSRYPRKSDSELFAMLTYQYASYFFAMKEREQRTVDRLEELDMRIAGVLKEGEKGNTEIV